MKRSAQVFVMALILLISLNSAYCQVQLTMGSWRTEDRDFYENVIKAFQKTHPDIEIAYEPTKNTEYNTKLNIALQTGSGPDIIHLRPYGPGVQLAEDGYLEPLSGRINGLEQYADATLAASRASDGKVYGVPAKFSSTQIFYNKDIFEKYALQEPASWDELIAIADTLRKNGVAPFAMGSKDGWILSLTHATLGPTFFGGKAFVKKLLSGEADFTCPEFVKSIQMMKDLTPYLPKFSTGVGMEEMRSLFTTGKAAMFIMGDWEIAVLKKEAPDLNFDLFPIPSATGAQPTITTWVDASYAVNAQSKHKEEALQFVEFLTSQTFGEMVSEDLHSIPTIPGVKASDPLISKILRSASNPETSEPYMILIHFNQGNPSTKTEFQNLLQGMYLEKLSPEEVAQGVQKSADTWFKPVQ
ncbi:sugar ABC transporter substrate-binding protein [candidate division KSB3 bacterium]|uniref:Sugar ABC transporter substrate-binding protein n=1 Tax=candidate division KSB3 bacterium TaxID=2044937 RepID=A0A2G6E430_9BACT|nr:MAG: sugar ABC transporter substrate-binding protein [candidate division KSB3 bacterium]PIE29098.1 MAG: sugar ABC transporter substrate-binding protein [candidate division KSB3 bacterium]